MLWRVTNSTTRLDAVWDTYQEGSLKSQTRTKRDGGTRGHRTRVSASMSLPKGSLRQKFLLNNKNKDEFFQFAAFESDMEIFLLTTKAPMQQVDRGRHSHYAAPTICCTTGSTESHHQDCGQRHCHPCCFTLSSPESVRNLGWTGHREMVQRHPTQLLGPKKCKALAFFHAFLGCHCASASPHNR